MMVKLFGGRSSVASEGIVPAEGTSETSREELIMTVMYARPAETVIAPETGPGVEPDPIGELMSCVCEAAGALRDAVETAEDEIRMELQFQFAPEQLQRLQKSLQQVAQVARIYSAAASVAKP